MRPLAPHPVLREYYRDEAERRLRVDQLFGAAAPHYDWINRMMSLGSGRRYRREALLRAGLAPGQQLLDVGTGTGVLALLGQEIVGAAGTVVAIDPCPAMLEVARAAGVRRLVPGHAERLPVADASFDLLTMGYALRHVADLGATFTEYRRVLRPGARLLILELTRPQAGFGYQLLKFYLKTLVPRLTRLLRRSREAQTLMRYYWDTIDHCVPPATILASLEAAGFEQVRREVVLGIFSEYSAVRPQTATLPAPSASAAAS